MATSTLFRSLLLLTLILVFASCSNDDDPVVPEGGTVDITPGVSSDIHVDEGHVGLVIDVRRIFKKGYIPTTAQISFPDHSRFNASLPVDPYTNLAILDIHNTDLTEEEAAAFVEGVNANIVVSDGNKAQLVSYDDTRLELDDSNLPLSLTTALPNIPQPLSIRENIPYLLQPEGQNGVLGSYCSDCFQIGDYTADNFAQQFYFTLVQGGDPDTYHITHPGGWSEGSNIYLYIQYDAPDVIAFTYWNLRQDNPDEFVLEQDDEGWVKIKHKESGLYMAEPQQNGWFGGNGDGNRFRLISDHIDWDVQDRGTDFNQPIMPPAKLDFAYSGTLRNCSSATLEEAVGNTESRTRTTTVGTSESFQVFSSVAIGLGVKIGFEVTAKVGVDVEGIGEVGEEVSVSEEVSLTEEYTYSETNTTAKTWSATTSKTSEVSRTRTLTIPPFTGLEVYDAVKTVEGVRVPFTQVLRVRATDRITSATLSGPEIVTQMRFNFVTGVVSEVGTDFADISIRGYASIDEVFEATTDVSDIEGACSGK